MATACNHGDESSSNLKVAITATVSFSRSPRFPMEKIHLSLVPSPVLIGNRSVFSSHIISDYTQSQICPYMYVCTYTIMYTLGMQHFLNSLWVTEIVVKCAVKLKRFFSVL